MDAGELVPDDLVMDLVREHLDTHPSDGVIFDGFPRTDAQATGLADVLSTMECAVDSVLLFEADDALLIQRISGRRSCPECGAVYNVYFTPPAEDGVCDHCGQRLIHRLDDQEDTVRRRLEVYREQTAPLISHYVRQGPAPMRIAAGRQVEDIQRDVRDALGAEPSAGDVS
jgi:adenylate kinase